MQKIMCVIGTRPEVIKMAPIIMALKNETWADVRIVATGQHKELLDSALELFNLQPDVNLNIMSHDQTLSSLTAELITKLDQQFISEPPQIVIAQGDTTTVFATALVCFYHKIDFCHVESGLRTAHITTPFPEEMNRVLTDQISAMHFAPTEKAKNNLIKEGISLDNIYVTGNTVVDALNYIKNKKIPHRVKINNNKRLILLTSHRRENFGEPLKEICAAIKELIKVIPDIQIVYPMHPNPNVQKIVKENLSNCPRVILCRPLNYGAFVSLMNDAYLILTDSGGIQEEATVLGKPTLVLRESTERQEGVELGVTKLVGSNKQAIVNATLELLNNDDKYAAMVQKNTIYGDGKSAEYIIKHIKEKYLQLDFGIKFQNFSQVA